MAQGLIPEKGSQVNKRAGKAAEPTRPHPLVSWAHFIS